MKTLSHLSLVVVLVFAGACSTEPAPPVANCVPSRTVYNDTTKQMLQDHCSSCHGATPAFGAPNSLIDYDAMLKGLEGKRPVDRIAIRVADKTMPAAGQAPPPHQVQDTLVEWASCGAMHPDHSIGLGVSKPVFRAPVDSPTTSAHFDLLAPDFKVGPKVLDLYMCFTFDTPVKADQFVQRIEPVVDDSRVLHHIVLLRDPKKKTKVGAAPCKGMPNGAQYMYAWAPGTGAVEFAEGGVRVTPGERYILQVHYNNGAGVADARDSSGVRIYHFDPKGTEYGMFAPGPVVFAIPANSVHTATGTCIVKEKMTLIAGMPHMHELGTKFSNIIVRKDGKTEELISISGWQFEMQPFYSFPVTLQPGDRIVTSCTWENKTAKSVTAGTGTADEMCFNFIFATPPPKNAYCNNFVADKGSAVTYFPGACVGPNPIANPPKVNTPLMFKAAPKVSGGQLQDGHWTLTSSTLYAPAAFSLYVDKDSFTVAKGQVAFANGKLHFDVSTRVLVKLKGGQGTDNTSTTSVSGEVVPGAKPGQATLKPDCGTKANVVFNYGIDGNKLTIIIDQKILEFTVPAVYEFKRD
jgi:hypothetical protein